MQVLTPLKNTKKPEFKKLKPIKMANKANYWALLASFILTMLGIFGFYTNAIKKVEDNAAERAKKDENYELRIKYLENGYQTFGTQLNEVAKDQTKILILLQNKQDRK